MNYLVHLFLSDPTPECLLGNLMGDFVKGRLDDTFPPEIRRGIAQHRTVDSFAQRSLAFRQSKSRLDERYRHGKGILVDIFYDHFMARNWRRHADIPLNAFARHVYRLLEAHVELLPPGLQAVAPRMIAHNWLESYREEKVIGRVLERISARLRRPTLIGEGLAELEKNYAGLERDFEAFLPEALGHLRAGGEKRN